MKLVLNFILLLLLVQSGYAQTLLSGTTSLVSIDQQGNLCYNADAMGNTIPDFSMVGYHQGLLAIPDVPVQITLTPKDGDRYEDIQEAINTVASLSPDANGHRGTILLTAGSYEVSQTLKIKSSGIVIRGEGKRFRGTVVEYTATTQSELFEIGGSANVLRDFATAKQVTDSYVPIGAKSMTVQSGHSFQVGDRVVFTLTTNAAWIALLGADQLESICGTGHSNWNPGSIHFKRKVTNVQGDVITLDAPVVDPVDAAYNIAVLTKYNWPGKIEECGIENIRLLSSFTSDVDEEHGWTAIEFRNIENAWVNNVEGYHFGYSLVSALAGAYQITIQDCGMFDYKSRVTGSRRYGFYSDDSDLILFKNCLSDQGRHDFVQGSRTPGPNVYTNCIATNSSNDTGPHHRWSTGTLWDLVSSDNAINVQNRECSGSGHGWAGAQQVFWNCTAPKMILQDPPAQTMNWAIGCTANITNQGTWLTEPLGFLESQNNPIASIPSLYEAQLTSRLNAMDPSIIAECPVDSKGLRIKVMAALQGPMQNSGTMNTFAASNGLVPLEHPHAANHNGTESVSAIPANVVDWVLLELRDASNAATIIESRACFITNDGAIVDLDGISGVSFDAPFGTYYVAINHKSHLGIISNTALALDNDNPIDFTTSLSSVLGNDQMVMESGKASMKVGDYDGNNTINFLDFLNWFAVNNFLNAYESADSNLDGTINFLDFLEWFGNNNALGVAEMN